MGEGSSGGGQAASVQNLLAAQRTHIVRGQGDYRNCFPRAGEKLDLQTFPTSVRVDNDPYIPLLEAVFGEVVL